MRFDHTMPGDGIEVYSTLEQGRVRLELQVCLVQEEGEQGLLLVLLYDRAEELAMECWQQLPQEELCTGVLQQPHLWKGTVDPYCYRMEAWLLQEGHCVDSVCRPIPIRELRHIPEKGWKLNGEPFTPKAVFYPLPSQMNAGRTRGELLEHELGLLRRMGANMLCVRDACQDEEFRRLCDRYGFVLYYQQAEEGGRTAPEMPVQEPLVLDGLVLPERYYELRARWSKEPFVHICTHSLTRQENGCYQIKIYSNCRKVALFVDGKLFEFQQEPPEFLFHELPGEREFLLLSAEGEGCSTTAVLPVHRLFTEQTLFDNKSAVHYGERFTP